MAGHGPRTSSPRRLLSFPNCSHCFHPSRPCHCSIPPGRIPPLEHLEPLERLERLPSVMSFLTPFEYEFFRNGFIAAVVIGALSDFIGVYVVLRRMSYIGHGLSHAIFGGAVLSYVLNIHFFIR